jgi:hypothetical protein
MHASTVIHQLVIHAYKIGQLCGYGVQHGVPRPQVGSLLQKYPLILSCNPSAPDKFPRHAIHFAALVHLHGPDILQEQASNATLTPLHNWAATQRRKFHEGAMRQDRAEILLNLQFDLQQARSCSWCVGKCYNVGCLT